MDQKIDFIYLSEQDMIKAGVTNMHKCVETMIEMFDLLGKGDYLMGGANGNSHGVKLHFPKESKFKNMPLAGPDRRFSAMIGYLGGRFNICGEKWYGSNIANKEKGLPRSILMVMLNDVVTGAPKVLMSANVLSAMRTGAIPGVGAKFLAKKDSETIGIVGAGVIGKTSLLALLEVSKNIKEVKIYDLFMESADKLSKEISKEYKINAHSVGSMEEAVRDSDIVNIATSGKEDPEIKEEWLKEGVLLSLPGGANLPKPFILNTKLVVDNWKTYENYGIELVDMEGGYASNLSGMCGPLLDYVKEGSLSKGEIINLGDIVVGTSKGRENDKEKIIFVMDGMPIEDIAWGYTVYQNALDMGLGITLNLWEKPYLF